jgi:hypothetical protein
MTSVLNVETTFFWCFDYPDLMARFRDLLAEKMVELNSVLREFSGNNQPGWWITDDNCALFNRKLYGILPAGFGEVLNAMAPGDAPATNTPTARWATCWIINTPGDPEMSTMARK